MSGIARTQDEYRRQIVRCAQALAVARNQDVEGFVMGAAPAAVLSLFTDGNIEKRIQKLQDQFELMSEAFEDLDDWIGKYVRHIPLDAYDTGSSDGNNFVRWLENRLPLTPEQRDFVVCQQSRYDIELAAENNRIAHIRFQDLRSLAGELAGGWDHDAGLRMSVNPLTVRAAFYTHALLDDEAELPSTVIFFPVGSDIHTAVLEPPAELILTTLQTSGPCRLRELEDRMPALEREEIVEVSRDLADVGLAAFG